MDTTTLAIVLLAPPALFGLAVAWDDWITARRQRQAMAQLEEAQRRLSRDKHPTHHKSPFRVIGGDK